MHKTVTSKKFVKPEIERKVLTETEKYEPSEMVINNILNYSKALSIKGSKLVEHVEVVLN